MPEALFVFLAPPSWSELVRRLVGRGTEDERERERRLETARIEMAAEAEFDVTIVNHEVHDAAQELVALMKAPSLPADRQSVVSGKSVSVRVDLVGRRIIQTHKQQRQIQQTIKKK